LDLYSEATTAAFAAEVMSHKRPKSESRGLRQPSRTRGTVSVDDSLSIVQVRKPTSGAGGDA
jgi:hypothetical protein